MKRTAIVAAALGALSASAAWADEQYQDTPPAMNTTPPIRDGDRARDRDRSANEDPNYRWSSDPEHPALMTRIGMTAEAGGGVGGFTDSRMSDVTSAEGVWSARLTVGSRTHLGAEAAYTGSAQRLSTFGVDPNARLVGNGVEGAVRWNVLTGMWQPYLLAGVGWTHYNVTNTPVNTSDVQDNGDVAQFPLGAGLAWRYSGFVADARFTYHPAASSPLIQDANLSTWDVAGRVGFEF